MLMPLLNVDNQQGKLEESTLRGELQLSIMQDALTYGSPTTDDLEMEIKTHQVALDKQLLTLVQGACKADNLARALDVARLMHNPSTVEAASKVAAFYHLPGLQERILGVKADVEAKRMKERRVRAPPASSAHHAQVNRFTDFKPKPARRNYGDAVQRDSTPAYSAGSYVPETPDHYSRVAETPVPEAGTQEGEYENGARSPKRPRETSTANEDDLVAPLPPPPVPVPALAPSARSMASSAPKNPFAKKASSNPFTKPASAKPLDAVKSTSFFDRVDELETGGGAKGAKRAKRDKAEKGEKGAGPKQSTLFGMKKGNVTRPPPAPIQAEPESLASTVTETGDDEEDAEEETQGSYAPAGVLEESMVQDTASPEPIDAE